MVVVPGGKAGLTVVEVVVENDVAAEDGQRRKAVAGVESWLPAEADHDEK